MHDALDCDRVNVFLLDSDKDELWTKNFKNEFITRIPIKDDLIGICFNKQQILNIRNAYGDNRFDQSLDEIHNYQTNNLMLCPIQERRLAMSNMHTMGTSTGVLMLLNKNNGHFNDDDAATLKSMAQIISVLQHS